MKTKLVNKKVIFALVMSLALVLSYSSFAFAKTDTSQAGVQKGLEEAKVTYGKLVDAKLQQKEDLVKNNKGLSQASKDAKKVSDGAQAKVDAEQAKIDAFNKLKTDFADKEKAVEDAQKVANAASQKVKDLEAEKAKIDDPNPTVKADKEAAKDKEIAEAKEAEAAATADLEEAKNELAEFKDAKKYDAKEKAAKDAEKALPELKEEAAKALAAFEEAKAKDVLALDAEIAALQDKLGDTQEMLNNIAKGQKIDTAKAKELIKDAKAEDTKAAKADGKAAPKAGNGPQTADAQDLVAYVLGLAMVSAGAVYTFRKRNLNK